MLSVTADIGAGDGNRLQRRAGPQNATGVIGHGVSKVNLETQCLGGPALAGRRRRNVGNEDQTSSEESSAGCDTAAAMAQRKARRRLTLHLAEAVYMACSTSSLLESKSVSGATLKSYRESLARFKEFARRCRLPLIGDGNVDAALVQHFTAEYLRGSHPSRGERTLGVDD